MKLLGWLVMALVVGCSSEPSGGSDPVGACADGCPVGAACDGTECRCLAGFVANGDTCERELDTTPLEQRSREQVCARWREGMVVTATKQYTPAGGGMCDAGTISPAAVVDAANRWSMYRWLSGLPPVSVDGSHTTDMQGCALMLGFTFEHGPPPTTSCYTAEAAAASSNSMICSASDAAGCMDLYSLETHQLDGRLSHRKIVLGVGRDNVAFGVNQGGSCALYGYASAGTVVPASPPILAVPNPGVTPIQAASAAWSVHQTAADAPLPIGDVQLFDETTNAAVPVRQQLKYAGINSWDLMSPPLADHTYRVTLTDGTATLTYRVTPVQCN